MINHSILANLINVLITLLLVIIGFVNQKGGSGKTTGAVHFSRWAQMQKGSGSIFLLDCDLQGSCIQWASKLGIPAKTLSDPEEIYESLKQLSQQYEVVVVDGPGQYSEVSKAILGRCDIALIPCKPSTLDVHSTGKILRIVRHMQELRGGLPQAKLYLNQAVRGTVLLRESRDYLSQFPEVELLNAVVFNRQCIADAPGQISTAFDMSGKTAKEAASDFNTLFELAMGRSISNA